jgi:hypothetical protein
MTCLTGMTAEQEDKIEQSNKAQINFFILNLSRFIFWKITSCTTAIGAAYSLLEAAQDPFWPAQVPPAFQAMPYPWPLLPSVHQRASATHSEPL